MNDNNAIIERRLREFGVVPVVVIPDAKAAPPTAMALASGGLGLIEIAFRSPASANALAAIVQSMPDILAGAGTVLNREQAAQALDAGASFIVSPGLDENTADFCAKNSLLYIPGCYTATEIQRALNLGLRLVKFFPAEGGGGLPMLSALAAAFPDASFAPTGGLKPDNFGPYLASRFVAFIGSSWMAPKNLIADRDFPAISARAAIAVKTANQMRKEKRPA